MNFIYFNLDFDVYLTFKILYSRMSVIQVMSEKDLLFFLRILYPYQFGEDVYQKQINEIKKTHEKLDITPPTASTPIELIPRILDLLKVGPGKIFVDLGLGFGQLLVGAAEIGAFAIGYEVREDAIKLALDKIRESGLEKRIGIYSRDIKTSIEGIESADLVYLYLSDKLISCVAPELIKRLKNGCLVGSFRYEIYNLRQYLLPTPTLDAKFYLYQIRK